MSNDQIRFEDGASYERYMGIWSQLVAAKFLTWLAPQQGLSWLDVGCGNGAFTEMIFKQHQPSTVTGIDPAPAQIAYAHQRLDGYGATLYEADAQNVPLDDNSVNIAVMPLVIFFVPEPAKGVAEMARVVAPGGTVAAYTWDMFGGGFPYSPIQKAITEAGVTVPYPPSIEASRMEVMHELWLQAGLSNIQTEVISVTRSFVDFADYWETVLGAPSIGPQLNAMSASKQQAFQAQIRATLPLEANGQITLQAHANAIKGVVAR
ncbi:class I SAM-dependent methyltransferase [Herpetosiphon llansteffanensis]|uniref:class I SAM-dependent methyltransferase n=1 Tax=Herpetosiphon llansteffanensis TaxID=2094568 RepID=UPI000D7BF35F|nr:class I SAM-dependent methyltransferase [Herpetosiphon llansteffanensis]